MYCLQLVSHKFLRWMIGPLLVPIFVINALLWPQHWLYRLLFLGQVAYYGLTGLGYLLNRRGVGVKPLSFMVFLNTAYLAYVIALFRFLSGQRSAKWAPAR
jgi:drug/metabolite transporter (DMT)-like permease